MLYPLLVKLRALQLSAHFYHNVVSGPTFFQDHDYFAEVYEGAEGDYDDVVERMLGTGEGIPALPKIVSDVSVEISTVAESIDVEDYFRDLLVRKADIIGAVQDLVSSDADLSEGTIQLIGEIANKAEKDVYKIKKRLGL